MNNRVAIVSSLMALTLVAPAVAQVPRVVEGPALVAVGKVISVDNHSVAVQTEDHGHRISFAVGTTTVMPRNLAVGSRVRVAYHAIGTTGQMADEVTLLAGPPSASLGSRAARPGL
jgi:hypothetical protein